MSNLATNEKLVLEKLFQMGDGYVLNFSDRTFAEFFRDDVGVDICDKRYAYKSGSKANRMRGFWQVAENALVGKSIIKLLSYLDTQILIGSLKRENFSHELNQRARAIAGRLGGSLQNVDVETEGEFIAKQFGNLPLERLGLDSGITAILKQRIDEIKKSLGVKAALGSIFLCGSTLEGILLGVASMKAKEFNQCKLSPKDKATGKVKQFSEWTLNDFINVARDLKLLGEDVKKFSHALRDFRNYIHPYQQLSSGFDPDEHTARICWQVLQAAIIQLSN